MFGFKFILKNNCLLSNLFLVFINDFKKKLVSQSEDSRVTVYYESHNYLKYHFLIKKFS